MGIAYGGYLAMKEEGTSFGDTADRLSGGAGDRPSGGPPPPPPPPPSSPHHHHHHHLRHHHRRLRHPPARGYRAYAAGVSAIPAAIFFENAIAVIIGLTPTEVGKREVSAT